MSETPTSSLRHWHLLFSLCAGSRNGLAPEHPSGRLSPEPLPLLRVPAARHPQRHARTPPPRCRSRRACPPPARSALATPDGPRAALTHLPQKRRRRPLRLPVVVAQGSELVRTPVDMGPVVSPQFPHLDNRGDHTTCPSNRGYVTVSWVEHRHTGGTR